MAIVVDATKHPPAQKNRSSNPRTPPCPPVCFPRCIRGPLVACAATTIPRLGASRDLDASKHRCTAIICRDGARPSLSSSRYRMIFLCQPNRAGILRT